MQMKVRLWRLPAVGFQRGPVGPAVFQLAAGHRFDAADTAGVALLVAPFAASFSLYAAAGALRAAEFVRGLRLDRAWARPGQAVGVLAAALAALGGRG